MHGTGCTTTYRADTIITKVNIINVETGAVLESQDLSIVENRIYKILSHSENINYKAEKIIDGSGKYIIPGLWDMHVHLFDDGRPNLWKLKLMTTYGVTGVREMYILPNEQVDTLKLWNSEINNNQKFIPRIGAMGTLVDGSNPIFKSVDTVITVESAREFTIKLKNRGVDFVKTYDHISKEVFDALVDEAAKQDMYVAGHIPKSVSIEYASRAGMKSIEHLTGLNLACSQNEDDIRTHYLSSNFNTIRLDIESSTDFLNSFDSNKLEQVISTLSENGTWMVPTLVVLKNWMNAETTVDLEKKYDLNYIPEAEYNEWQMMRDFKDYVPVEYQKSIIPLYHQQQNMLLKMHQGNVPILAGTDVGVPYIFPGLSLIEELKEMVASGLTNLEALQTATLNPSIYLNRTDELGTINEGKLADFVILLANPLEDINNLNTICATSINGNVYDKEKLNILLEEVLDLVKERN